MEIFLSKLLINMRPNLRFPIAFLIVSIMPFTCFSQKYANQIQSVETVVHGINHKDYKEIKKAWGPLGKIVIRKNMLEEEFLPFTEKYGEVTIDTIVFANMYTATAQLISPVVPEKRTFMQFIFNEKGKLQGMGTGYPTFIYRNADVVKNHADDAQQIDSVVQKRVNAKEEYRFNGCILVSSGDSILYKRSVGFRNFQDSLPLNDSSLFLLASCSKQFTAVAIMQLHEKGKLNYNDPVNKYLPDFPYPAITIEELLTHTSGLPDYMGLLKKHWDHSKFAVNADVLNLLAEHKPKLLFEPGAMWSYSNTGYVVLSSIIQAISNQSYGEYLRENIFEPLHMDQTLVYYRRMANDSLPNYANGYVFSEKENKYVLPDSLSYYHYVSYMDGITGDDGVSSNLLDLQKWNEGLRKNTLLSAESTRKMNTPFVLENGNATDYGYGIFLKEGANIQDLEYHTGSWPGYTTVIMRFPDSDKTIILLSNSDYDNFATLVDAIAVIVL